ncbi:MAG: hypothetical protein RJP95_02615 [Pirellulales bacterium]
MAASRFPAYRDGCLLGGLFKAFSKIRVGIEEMLKSNSVVNEIGDDLQVDDVFTQELRSSP